MRKSTLVLCKQREEEEKKLVSALTHYDVLKEAEESLEINQGKRMKLNSITAELNPITVIIVIYWVSLSLQPPIHPSSSPISALTRPDVLFNSAMKINAWHTIPTILDILSNFLETSQYFRLKNKYRHFRFGKNGLEIYLL